MLAGNLNRDLPSDLPAELAHFDQYNAAVVAFRFYGRRRSAVSLDRWIEAAKWAAGEAVSGWPERCPEGRKMTAVLAHLGLTKAAGYEKP